jgi:dTMP kinase
VVLDVPLPIARARLAQRGGGLDRYERLGEPFFARVRDGFAAIAAAEPARCVVIAGDDAPDVVAERVWQEVTARLGVP